ncbi:hypothetical protein GOP47_0023876 [Adiantum capillus-veneris]|uniref:GDSL esterase/lipase n=2 Tax=Adiantum capillus-veneris TaxID=13818 RepID=A0A9D4U4C7_ADICA|nr:hypothetical protein GOP47_0023876 [Adiantum capillus-veneris]
METQKLIVLPTILLLITANMKEPMKDMVADAAASSNPLFPAMFVFGDSLLDPGNNVLLASASSALPRFLSSPNHPPYGRDLPSHLPTGRYSNGLLLSDILARHMDLPYPPPYLSKKDNFTKGTSFAFGGAVIFNIRRKFQTPRIDFYNEVSYFKDFQEELSTSMGEDGASELILKSLFLIWIGSNDYLVNYYSNPFGQGFAQKRYTAIEFRETLISLYRQQIVRLYGMGARKFALVSLPPIGCTPVILLLFSRSDSTTCIDVVNEEVKNYNALLLKMSKELQGAYPSAQFTYLDAYDHSLKFIQDPKAFGFKDSLHPCCALGPYGGVPICSTSINSICDDASQYVYWDFAHPTESAFSLAANWFLQGSPPDVQPFNLQQLSAL